MKLMYYKNSGTTSPWILTFIPRTQNVVKILTWNKTQCKLVATAKQVEVMGIRNDNYFTIRNNLFDDI